MQVRDLILAMRRHEGLDGEGRHRFDGYLDYVCEEEVDRGRVEFQGVLYREAIRLLAQYARKHQGARLFIVRLDQRPQKVALQLDGPLSKLIRDDPVAFMELMDPTMGRPQKLGISTGVKKEHSASVKPNPLPAGHDTLADSFGEYVYVRLKDDKTESVWDGRWYEWHHNPYSSHGGQFISIPDDLYKAPDECRLTQDPYYVNEKWARYETKQLLEVAERRKQEKLFLPRRWNKDGPWIKTDDLRKKYDEFVKEKEACSRQHTAT